MKLLPYVIELDAYLSPFKMIQIAASWLYYTNALIVWEAANQMQIRLIVMFASYCF